MIRKDFKISRDLSGNILLVKSKEFWSNTRRVGKIYAGYSDWDADFSIIFEKNTETLFLNFHNNKE